MVKKNVLQRDIQMMNDLFIDLEDWIKYCIKAKNTVNNFGFLVKNRFNSTLLMGD